MAQLLTKKIIDHLPALESTRNVNLEDQEVICRYFAVRHQIEWFVFEGQKIEDGDYLFYGAIKAGLKTQLGYFKLSYLRAYKDFTGVTVHRDLMSFARFYRTFC